MKLTLPIIIVLGLLSGLTPLAIDAYLPSIPTISRSLDTEISLVQMTLSIYLFVFAFFQILFGPISDALGRRKVVVGGLGLFILGSLFCALALNYDMLVIGRVIQAIGGAAVAVCIPALVKDGLSTTQFAKAMSLVMLVMSLAPLVAPIVGGGILVLFNWHFIFIFLALLGILAIFLFLKTIPETLPKEHRTSLSLSSSIKNYVQLIKNPAVLGYIMASAFHFAGLMSFVTVSSFVYIELYGIKAEYFGFLFALNIITMMITTTINSQFVEKLGTDHLTKYASRILLLTALIMTVLAFFNHPPLAFIVVCSMLFTGMIGILGSGFMAGALKNAGNNNGSVTALAGTLRFSLGALSGGIASTLHNGTASPMLGTMAACGIAAYTCHWYVTNRISSATQE